MISLKRKLTDASSLMVLDRPVAGHAARRPGVGATPSPDGGPPLETFTVCTTTPNRITAPIHDRMPVILEGDAARVWMDPGASPEALAYAIQESVFSDIELKKIRFDGETPATFMEGRVANLVEEVIQQLVSGPPAKVVYKDTGTTCADGGPCLCD